MTQAKQYMAVCAGGSGRPAAVLVYALESFYRSLFGFGKEPHELLAGVFDKGAKRLAELSIVIHQAVRPSAFPLTTKIRRWSSVKRTRASLYARNVVVLNVGYRCPVRTIEWGRRSPKKVLLNLGQLLKLLV